MTTSHKKRFKLIVCGLLSLALLLATNVAQAATCKPPQATHGYVKLKKRIDDRSRVSRGDSYRVKRHKASLYAKSGSTQIYRQRTSVIDQIGTDDSGHRELRGNFYYGCSKSFGKTTFLASTGSDDTAEYSYGNNELVETPSTSGISLGNANFHLAGHFIAGAIKSDWEDGQDAGTAFTVFASNLKNGKRNIIDVPYSEVNDSPPGILSVALAENGATGILSGTAYILYAQSGDRKLIGVSNPTRFVTNFGITSNGSTITWRDRIGDHSVNPTTFPDVTGRTGCRVRHIAGSDDDYEQVLYVDAETLISTRAVGPSYEHRFAGPYFCQQSSGNEVAGSPLCDMSVPLLTVTANKAVYACQKPIAVRADACSTIHCPADGTTEIYVTDFQSNAAFSNLTLPNTVPCGPPVLSNDQTTLLWSQAPNGSRDSKPCSVMAQALAATPAERKTLATGLPTGIDFSSANAGTASWSYLSGTRYQTGQANY